MIWMVSQTRSRLVERLGEHLARSIGGPEGKHKRRRDERELCIWKHQVVEREGNALDIEAILHTGSNFTGKVALNDVLNCRGKITAFDTSRILKLLNGTLLLSPVPNLTISPHLSETGINVHSCRL